MNVLITGAAGFIGMNLAKNLLAEGHHVVGFDNFNDYYPVSLKRARHEQLLPHPHYTGIEADLCDMEALQGCFKANRFDVVCNLAAQAGVRYSLDHPHAYQKANLEAFLNVLECCRHAEVPRLVYASSSSVYGGNTKLPFSESDSVDSPVSLYAATKKANELMAHCYTHLYGLQTIGLRFFTVYGPWGRPDMAYFGFTQKILAGEPIDVFNNGDMRRDFTYIDDIVDGVINCLGTPPVDDGTPPCRVYNIGNNQTEGLMDMIGLIEDALGQKAEINMMGMQAGDFKETFADITETERDFNFSPKTRLADGIPRFIGWYRDFYSI